VKPSDEEMTKWFLNELAGTDARDEDKAEFAELAIHFIKQFRSADKQEV